MHSITSLDAMGRGLRVRWERQGDRLRQVVSLVDPEGESRWLMSVEGSGEQEWPASPPLQQLHIEPRAEGAVALLVGMSGKSHWSLSVEPAPGGSLLFDAACQYRQSGIALMTYLADSDWHWSDTEQYAESAVATRRGRIQEIRGAKLQLAGPQLQLASDGAHPPGTLRWQFRLHVVQG